MSRRGSALLGTMIGVVIAAALIGSLSFVVRKSPKIDIEQAAKELAAPAAETPPASPRKAAGLEGTVSSTEAGNIYKNPKLGLEFGYPNGYSISTNGANITLSKDGKTGTFIAACENNLGEAPTLQMKNNFAKEEDIIWRYSWGTFLGKFETGLSPFFAYRAGDFGAGDDAAGKAAEDIVGASCAVGLNDKGHETVNCLKLRAASELGDDFLFTILPSLKLDEQFKNTPACIGVGESRS